MSFIDIRGTVEYLPEQEDVRAAKLLHLVEDYMGKDMAEALEPYLEANRDETESLYDQLEDAEDRIRSLEDEVYSLEEELRDLREYGPNR